MYNYRIHFDVSLGSSQDEAIALSNKLIEAVSAPLLVILKEHGVEEFSVRLGNDDDRSKKNYLNINENGHVAGGKTSIMVED